MAKQISYTDSQGTVQPVSYWHPQFIALDKQAKSFNVVFYGYVDANHRLTNKPSIGTHGYTDGGDPARYDKYFGAAAATRNVFQAAYLAAMDTNDVPNTLTPNDPLTNTNFFAGATDV